MKRTFVALTFGTLICSASVALALTPEQVVADYQAEGYSRVEVRVGPTQMKVEAIRGTEKREVIYDRASGAVVKAETEAVGAYENTRPGVSVRERNRDFARAGDDNRGRFGDDDSLGDDDSDHRGGRGGDDDNDSSDDNGGDRDRDDSRSDDDSNGRDDNDSDDNDNDDSGNDDNGGDDGGRGGNDDSSDRDSSDD